MPLAQVFLNGGEDDKVQKFSEKWNLSKHETIKKIIREFKEAKLDFKPKFERRKSNGQKS